MKQKTTKVLSMLLSLLLAAAVLCAAPLTVSAEEVSEPAEPNPYHAQGTCGAAPNLKDVEWYVFHDGSIAFFGTGAIENYPPNDGMFTAPWYVDVTFQSLYSTKVSIEDGITEIGAYAFYIPLAYAGYGQIKTIDLPNTLTKIGDYAFQNQNKLQKITIPKNVTSIGKGVFNGCKNLTHIDIYADPDDIKYWGDSEPFTQQVTCHLKPEYAGKIQKLTNLYSAKKHIKFEANLYYENNIDEEGVKRNIKGSFGQEHTDVLGNALPFMVVGSFSGAKKSVTYGNNGFASCVKIGNEYYVHTNNNSRNIQKATVNSLTGGVSSVDTEHQTLKLETTYDYIGLNIVRLKYTLKNEGETPINDVMLGGTGDIKIGADDYAAIKPMMKKNNQGVDEQIGFYMTSNKEFDKSGNEYATLGFIGKDVELKKDANNQTVYSEPATFFYGATAANKAESATGAFRHRLMPERVFYPNEGISRQTGAFDQGKDSGMSYYWNVGTLAAKETKEYAVMFSVYGEKAKSENSTGMIDEIAQQYYTVTWANDDDSVLEKQLVKAGETPQYTETPPVKEHDEKFDYEFSGWSPTIVACTEDTTYTAQFNAIPRQLFAGHSLTLGGDIGVKFYLDVPVADVAVDQVRNKEKTIVVKFAWFNKKAEYQLNKDGKNDYDTASGYFTAQCNVAAAEMAYTIHAEVYIDGKKYISESPEVKDNDDYSVREYGLHIINHPYDFSLPLVDLAKKMLDYGAKAQDVFDRIPDSPANAGVNYTMVDHDIETEEKLVYPKMWDGLDGTGLEYYNTSLLFNSKTGLRQYYRVKNKALFDKLSNRDKFKQNGTLYYLEVAEEIPAYELADEQIFKVGDSTYKYSALHYAMALQYSDDNDQKKLGTALYLYYKAAKTYFDSVGVEV